MIRLVTDERDQFAEMWTENPSIYLDHWAVRTFSRDMVLRDRFFRAFDQRGTLLFSLMNVVELAANEGRSADQIADFLRLVGPHWFATTMDPLAVIAREEASPGDPAAPAGDKFLRDPWFAERLLTGDLSLATVVELTRGAAGAGILAGERLQEAEIVRSIKSWRDRYAVRPAILDEKWPQLPLDALKPMRPIYNGLMRLCVTDGFTFDGNHVRDLFHACVPLAYADIVLLDPHWANQARQKLKLGPPHVVVYTQGEMDQFLALLESCPPSRAQR